MNSSPFITTRLYTEAGGFVVEGEIPRFIDNPRILVWGERYFRFSHGETEDGVDYLVYVEAFTVALVRELQVDSRPDIEPTS